METSSEIRHIAFLGDYLPRRCGIATFTTDLCQSVAGQFTSAQCLVVPVSDIEEGYDYPKEVRFEIKEKELSSYYQAADFLKSLESGEPCHPTFEDALQTQKVCEAVLESANSRSWKETGVSGKQY